MNHAAISLLLDSCAVWVACIQRGGYLEYDSFRMLMNMKRKNQVYFRKMRWSMFTSFMGQGR